MRVWSENSLDPQWVLPGSDVLRRQLFQSNVARSAPSPSSLASVKFVSTVMHSDTSRNGIFRVLEESTAVYKEFGSFQEQVAACVAH